MTSPDEPWLTVKRGEAPLLVSFPHTGLSVPAECATRPRIVSARAPRCRLAYRPALCLRRASSAPPRCTPRSRAPSSTSTAIRPAPRSIPARRPPASFRPRPSTAGRSTATAGARRRRRSSGASRSISRPITRRSPRRSARLRALHPRIVLYDCHSIRSVIPRLFPGELPVFNIGTNGGVSCDPRLQAAVAGICAASRWSHVVNGRFTGGWITRTYGKPDEGVHAVQMEMASAVIFPTSAIRRRGMPNSPSRSSRPCGPCSTPASVLGVVDGSLLDVFRFHELRDRRVLKTSFSTG